ncbi:MAG: RnfABCDGE type electron transport complex subunit D, partial [Bacillota bacterium]
MADYELTGPYVETEDTIEKNMLGVILALVPAVIVAFIFFGAYSLYLSLGTALLSTIIEFPFSVSSYSIKNPLGDGSAFLAGLLLGLTLPPGAPWWIPVIGAFLTIVIGKQVFGGIGNNIFNPALIARAFLLLSWPGAMTVWLEPFDGVSSATPLGQMLSGSVETGYWDLFLGNISGSIGETSALALLIGGLYLYINEYITWRIPVSFVVSAGVLSYFFGADPLYAVLSGGLLFGAIFMATDMVTSPVTKDARLVYGIGCGVFTVLIRHFTVYPEGITFAILLMNGAAYLFDSLLEGPHFGEVYKRRRTLKQVGSVILAAILLFGLAYGASMWRDNILASRKDDSVMEDGVYTGTGEGHNGDMEVEVTVENGEITEINVVDHQDTADIAESAFTTLEERIIEQQETDVDTVSGATNSSNGYLEAIQDALGTEEESAAETYTGSAEGMN